MATRHLGRKRREVTRVKIEVRKVEKIQATEYHDS